MKRYLIIATVLVAILLTVFTGAALAEEEDLTLDKLANALTVLTERTNRHDERLDALEEFVESLLTATPTEVPEEPLLTIKWRMNVWRGPGTNHDILGAVEAGAEFEITGRNVKGDWWQISYEGSPGWVYAPYMTADGSESARFAATPTALLTATPRQTATPTPIPLPNRASARELAEFLLERDMAYEYGDWIAVPYGIRADAIAEMAHMLSMKSSICKHNSVRETAEMVHSHATVLEEAGVTAEGLGWFDPSDYFRFRALITASYKDRFNCDELLDALAERWIAEQK